jgi:prepilin-type N-terminal cleavage/methylation domain-containing protein
MVSMHIIEAEKDTARSAPADQRGFTLVELLVSTFLGAIILAAVLTVFVMIAKTQNNVGQYVDMERDAQRALERFSQDARMASLLSTGIVGSTTPITDITLTIPQTNGAGVDTVRYYFSGNRLIRYGRDPVTNAANTTTVLATDVQSGQFKRWKLASIGPADVDPETDLLQIQILMKKQRSTAVSTSDLVVSASYLLRNHKTT